MPNCYLVRRSKGENLYLSPYVDSRETDKWREDEELKWLASTGLTTQEKDGTLYLLYSEIDKGVDRWILDKRYIPRLLISAVVFLIVYFFFALAVRDPIPVIDELLLGLAAAIGVATYLTKRDKKGDLAMKKRMVLKQNAMRSQFLIDEKVSVVEKYLDKLSNLEVLDLADRLALVTDQKLPPLNIDDNQWKTEFSRLLLANVKINNKNLYSRYEVVMKNLAKGKSDEALSARLAKLAYNRVIDLPLISLMVVFTKH
ncbi:MAG: hypothetical protein WCY53_03565 [Sphaerochaetaceae bacterium]